MILLDEENLIKKALFKPNALVKQLIISFISFNETVSFTEIETVSSSI